MRVKSELWVKSYLRGLAGNGLPGYVVRRGDADAGAIFIRINRLDGSSFLFGPAPAGYHEIAGGRGWVPLLDPKGQDDSSVEDYLQEELEMDPDIWIVEVESRDGHHGLDDWLVG